MLEFEEYKVKLNACKPQLETLQSALKLEDTRKEIEELEAQAAQEGFWNDTQNSQKVLQRTKQLKNKVERFEKLNAQWDDLYTICEMALEENDESMLEELVSGYEDFEKKLEETHLSTLLSGEYDANNAILTFHAGAGGTEAQDWASMLYRMYNMWAERHGYKVKVMDYLDGDEAGITGWTDPDNRRTYPCGHEDLELVGLHQAMTRLRKAFPVLQHGSVKPLCSGHGFIAYARFDASHSVVMVCNNLEEPQTVSVPVRDIGIGEGCAMQQIFATTDTGHSAIPAVVGTVKGGMLLCRLSAHNAQVLTTLPTGQGETLDI